ncbi:MAG TPA: TolC family protein [Vicinamibacterales bacterium]|nr:TolC family protein [Vicinamibacterales bacterium]
MTSHRVAPYVFATFGLALLLSWPAAAAAQSRLTPPALPSNSPLLGGVPTGTATAEPIPLSIADAIRRALEHNLGVLQAEEAVERATGARWLALSELLPNVNGSVSETRRKTNLEAFGFPLGPTFPRVVGPFNVFDARVFLQQSVFDLQSINAARAESHQVSAARHGYRSARELVVLVAANLYLEGLAADARATTARAQLETAQALQAQAEDLRRSGIVAGIDVIRAEVRVSTERQRATAARASFEKIKLQLARVIGLPTGQAITLSDEIPPVPVPEMTLEQALDRAHRDRPDYLAAQDRLRAAEAAREAALAEHWPSVSVSADYGAIGLTAASALSTFAITGIVNVPVFDGGKTRAHVVQATADRNNRRAELDDMRAEIDYDVRAAFLDLQSTSEQLQAATRARELSALQLTQSRDRFAAGVANNIEVIQAQEAVALANEQYIDALFGYNLSKAVLGRALGTVEEAIAKYLGGK